MFDNLKKEFISLFEKYKSDEPQSQYPKIYIIHDYTSEFSCYAIKKDFKFGDRIYSEYLDFDHYQKTEDFKWRYRSDSGSLYKECRINIYHDAYVVFNRFYNRLEIKEESLIDN